MPIHCRHEANDQSLPRNEIQKENVAHTHIIDSNFGPEKHFEPWNLSDSSKNRIEQSKTPNFVRNHGWDEIEQSEEEAKRLRQLLSIWDAERIAILKLQYDLDKNIFQRTFDYIKRLGQSVRLALWLWSHRPVNCSNISSLNQCEQQKQQQQQSLFPVTSVHKLQNSACFTNYPTPENMANQEFSIPSIDILADSLWYQRFILNEPQENLPPIARAMKKMLENDTFIWDSEIQMQSPWPHFINQYRVTQNKKFLRNVYENDEIQTFESFPSVTNTDTINKTKSNQHSSQETNTSLQLSMDNTFQPIDSQYLLKSPMIALKNHESKPEESKPHRSESQDKELKPSKVRRRSKTRNRKKSIDRKATNRSKSKTKRHKSRRPKSSRRIK
ncbi:unnamed protein product [Rotaria socialis]|uniref:Uncharacterized protein n=1 Tax=Rotaria socialis TaxID=392032 RepID=A0A821AM31_9BILA|nr:unnamed protein product [Rotaria socialis]CAF4574469.1 unnamed protein product [Rotaria socialis]